MRIHVYREWHHGLRCFRWFAACYVCPASIGSIDTWSHRHAMTWADNHVRGHRNGNVDTLAMQLDENEADQFRRSSA